MKQEFEILEYDPLWREKFSDEKENLVKIFGDNLNSIHHIGSTAIPNAKAKPEIDILLIVKEDSNLTFYNIKLEELGYVVRGECLDKGGTPGRFYYSKNTNNKRSHKLHICKTGHSEILPKLMFVKYLNDHIEMAEEYSDLETRLSKNYNYGRDFEKYLAGKSDFVKNVLEIAAKEYKEIKYEDFI